MEQKIPKWYTVIGERYNDCFTQLMERLCLHGAWTGTGDVLYDNASQGMKDLLAEVKKGKITLGEYENFHKWIYAKFEWIQDPRHQTATGMVPKGLKRAILGRHNKFTVAINTLKMEWDPSMWWSVPFLRQVNRMMAA